MKELFKTSFKTDQMGIARPRKARIKVFVNMQNPPLLLSIKPFSSVAVGRMCSLTAKMFVKERSTMLNSQH